MKTVFVIALLSTLLFPVMEAKNLLKPANKEDSWRLEQVDNGKAELKKEAKKADDDEMDLFGDDDEETVSSI